jgi:hypothetical protein
LENKDWNWDRAFSVASMLHAVSDDLMRTVHKGVPSQGVIDRMADMLRKCADDIETMRSSHD